MCFFILINFHRLISSPFSSLSNSIFFSFPSFFPLLASSTPLPCAPSFFLSSSPSISPYLPPSSTLLPCTPSFFSLLLSFCFSLLPSFSKVYLYSLPSFPSSTPLAYLPSPPSFSSSSLSLVPSLPPSFPHSLLPSLRDPKLY